MFEKVIVGFDGSDRALDALLLGQALTASGGEMIVCCVHRFQSLSARVDPTEPRVDRESAQKIVEEATRLLNRGLSVTSRVLAGASTARTLQRTAVAEHADLIVLGSSHRGALGRVFVGSVSEQTLNGAPCAVAIAPVGFRDQTSDTHFEHVAVGYDVVEPTPDALLVGIALCEQKGAQLLLVAVAEDAAVHDPARATMSYYEIAEARLRAGEQAIAEVIASVPETVSAAGEVCDGDPAEQLLEVTHGADLLVLGSHGRGAVGRLIMGSVCGRVVRAAACAVLVVAPTETVDAQVTTPSAISSAHES
jgi:nucleotide-binding universal stress UspA family protein